MTDPPESPTLRPRRLGTLVAAGILAVATVAFLGVAVLLNPLLWILIGISTCALGVVVFAALPGPSYSLRGQHPAWICRRPRSRPPRIS